MMNENLTPQPPPRRQRGGVGRLWFLHTKLARLMCLIVAGVLFGGCSALGPRPTPEPIFVTATPVAELPSPTPGDTAVIGPTPESTESALTTSAAFPTLPTSTNTPAPTQKPTLTPSFTPTYTDTPAPTQKAPTALKCTSTPQGGFAAIWGKDTTLQKALGCAQGPAVGINSASLTFDNGKMLWASQLGDVQTRVIYVLYNNGTYQRYNDTWVEGVDPESTGEIAPPGKLTPVRGFGKVWHNNPAVKNGLGWATGNEAGTPGQIQRFERGEMLFVAALGQTFIFVGGTSNTWRADGTPF